MLFLAPPLPLFAAGLFPCPLVASRLRRGEAETLRFLSEARGRLERLRLLRLSGGEVFPFPDTRGSLSSELGVPPRTSLELPPVAAAAAAPFSFVPVVISSGFLAVGLAGFTLATGDT